MTAASRGLRGCAASGRSSIPREQSGALVETVARSGLDPAALPAELRYDVVDGTPRPRVRVGRPERQNPYALRQDLRATVQFDYGGAIVEGPPGAAAYDAANRRLVRRDRAAEQAAIDRLHQLGFRYTWSHFESRQLLGISPEQFPRVVHTLVNEGWRVEAEGRPFRSAVGMRLEVSSGHRLVRSARLGRLRRRPVCAVPATPCRRRPRRGRRRPRRRERRAVAGGMAAALRGDRGIRQRRRGRDPVRALAGGAARRAARGPAGDHATTKRSPGCDPSCARFSGIQRRRIRRRRFQGTLREYQREALGWFEFLRRFDFGGCLADDMGLGKTVMVLALLDARRQANGSGERAPSIVVVPRSLVFNWRDEAARFAPKLKVVDYTGTQRDAVGDSRARTSC